MKLQTFGLIFLLAVLGEFIQTRDAYKSIRPYKYHRPRPRYHRPQFSQPSRYRPFKKGPRKIRYHSPNSAWNRPTCAADHIEDEQFYTIQIELPKRQHSYSGINEHYQKNFFRGYAHDFYVDDDYLDEEEEHFQKKVRIKVINSIEPKLRIKISRADIPVNTEFANSPIRKSSPQDNSASSVEKFRKIGYGE